MRLRRFYLATTSWEPLTCLKTSQLQTERTGRRAKSRQGAAMRWRYGWKQMALGSALLLAACGPDATTGPNTDATSSLSAPRAADTQHCASEPVEQVHVLGTTYWRSFSDVPKPEDLGEIVGTITLALPPEAFTCSTFELVDGQGSPPNGAIVYAITGIPTESAVATSINGQVIRYVNAATFGPNATR